MDEKLKMARATALYNFMTHQDKEALKIARELLLPKSTCDTKHLLQSNLNESYIMVNSSEKKLPSYFSFSIPGRNVVKNAVSYASSFFFSSEKKDPVCWKAVLSIPHENDQSRTLIQRSKGVYYLACWNTRELTIYNLNTGKVLAKHKVAEYEQLNFVEASKDGTCYAMIASDKECKRRAYLLNIECNEPPQAINFEHARFMHTENGGLHMLIRLEKKVKIHTAKNSSVSCIIDHQKDITHFSSLNNDGNFSSSSGYVLVQLKEGNINLHKAGNKYKRTEIACEKECTLVKNIRLPEGYFVTLCGKQLSLYHAPYGEEKLCSCQYNGGAILNGTMSPFISRQQIALIDDAQQLSLIDLKEQKITRINVGDVDPSTLVFSGDGETLCLRTKSTQKNPATTLVFYNTADGKKIFEQQLEQECGTPRACTTPWFYVEGKNYAIFINPVKQHAKQYVHTGITPDPSLHSCFALRSEFKKNIRIVKINGHELKETVVIADDPQGFGDQPVFVQISSYLAANDNNYAYVFDVFSGELYKKWDADSLNAMKGWRSNGHNLYAIVETRLIRILDACFNVTATLTLDSPVLDAQFEPLGTILKVITENETIYYGAQK